MMNHLQPGRQERCRRLQQRFPTLHDVCCVKLESQTNALDFLEFDGIRRAVVEFGRPW